MRNDYPLLCMRQYPRQTHTICGKEVTDRRVALSMWLHIGILSHEEQDFRSYERVICTDCLKEMHHLVAFIITLPE